MSSLNDAIQLIRQGRKEEARQILESLLRADPRNIQAWFWSVETYSNLEKRIQVLEICLKMNPGNSQVMQALQKLQSQRPPQQASYTPPPAPPPQQTSFSPPPAQPSNPAVSPFRQSLQSYSSTKYDDGSEASAPSPNTPIYFDDEPLPIEKSASQPGTSSWEKEGITYKDTFTLKKPEPEKRSYSFFEAWTTALLMKGGGAYEDVLDDPEAGTGRAFEWIAYAGIISGLLFPLTMMSNPQFAELRDLPEFNGLFGSLGTTAVSVIMALAMALLAPITGAIGLATSAWIQNLVAAFMGGTGDYRRTIYALAAYMAPIAILTSILGVIPVVGQCLTGVMGIYNLILNVRALQAAHSLSVGKALGVIFLPSIFLFSLCCLLVFVVGLPGLSGQ